MWNILVYLWTVAAVLSFGPNDSLAKKRGYATAFSKMAADFGAMKELMDTVEIRQKHAATIEQYGNFSVDPCEHFQNFSAEGYYTTVPSAAESLWTETYDNEVFKYLGRELLKDKEYFLYNYAEMKATDFARSCEEYVPSQEDLPLMARKLFAIVDRSESWSDAYVALHPYGYELFWHYSHYRSPLFVQKPSEHLSSKTLVELKDTVRAILQINKDAEGSVDDIAERVWRFKTSLEGCGIREDNTYPTRCSLRKLEEIYPALHIVNISQLLIGFPMKDYVNLENPDYMEDLNQLLEATGDTAIKEYMVVRVYESLKKSHSSFQGYSNTSDACYEATFEYFEPALKSYFINNYVSRKSMAAVKGVFEDYMEFMGRKVIEAKILNSTFEFENMFRVDTENIIDPIYMDADYLDSLYENLSFSHDKGFFEHYLDTVYNNNKMKIKCMGEAKLPVFYHEAVYPDHMKPHQLCRHARRPHSFPLRYFTVPFYNPAYPKYWTYGSLVWPYLYNFLMSERMSSLYLWYFFEQFYKNDVNSTLITPGYENLNLTNAQLFHVARIQGTLIQGDGLITTGLGDFNLEQNMRKDFKCKS